MRGRNAAATFRATRADRWGDYYTRRKQREEAGEVPRGMFVPLDEVRPDDRVMASDEEAGMAFVERYVG